MIASPLLTHLPHTTHSTSADFVQCRPLSIFSFLRTKQKRTIQSHIRDIVSAPNFTGIPSSVTPIVNACAATLSASEFSRLLQTPYIEGHTALYWAIVNNRREAFWGCVRFISQISSACTCDLCLACMTTNNHALFMQLNFGKTNGKMIVICSRATNRRSC